jgi:hypothetical protein
VGEEDIARLPAMLLKNRLRWCLSRPCISLKLADEIVSLSNNLVSRLDMVDASLSRLIDLYESEDVPTPEHAQAWAEARKIMGLRT